MSGLILLGCGGGSDSPSVTSQAGSAGIGQGGSVVHPSGGVTTQPTGGVTGRGGQPVAGAAGSVLGEGGSVANLGGSGAAPLGGAAGSEVAGGSTAMGGTAPEGGALTSGGGGPGGETAIGGSEPGGSGPASGGALEPGGTAGVGGETPAAAGAGGVAQTCTLAADCDDALFCNGTERCDNGLCAPGTAVECPATDGKSCTVDRCDEDTHTCVTLKDDQLCADSTVCNGAERCDPADATSDAATGCVAGTPLNCVDGFTCTPDQCDPVKGCPGPDDAQCDDHLFCNGTETCSPGAAGADSTTGCLQSAPPDCVDAVTCTVDSCNEETDQCVNQAVDSNCADDSYCNGAEVCDRVEGCKAGVPVTCEDDSIACTVESCDESSGSCVRRLDSSVCGDGQICTAANGCSAPTCENDQQCSDGDLCNGVETCNQTSHTCQRGTPVVCSDAYGCTRDSCNPTTGQCIFLPMDADCADATLCNGTETCAPEAAGANPTTGCLEGTPPDCNDGLSCTVDSCDARDGCQHLPQDSVCKVDDLFCNGTETCAPGTDGADARGCATVPPPTCVDDGVSCTVEKCDETLKACVHTPDHSKCPCGQTCDAAKGCGDYCVKATCQGKIYACGDCLDNDNDCKKDSVDPSCLGPCSDNETGFKGNIPGQGHGNCAVDCYFDQDSGGGNDNCAWDYRCDPHEVTPYYDPIGNKCDYNPTSACTTLATAQSSLCVNYCGSLTPNGCDCFGCCEIPGAPTTVYLGSEDAAGSGTCSLETLADPRKCRPCQQVGSCRNTCERCELCVGKTTVPTDCNATEQCPVGLQACGLPGQDPCPVGAFCITGCCRAAPV